MALEATHVYWIPLHELLEKRGFEVVLANARALYNLPGRHKSDFQDCQWLQLLHSRGLLRGSFRPREEIAKLRTLQRQLGNLTEERSRCVQWMQKALDQMNVQVHRAVSDVTGKTGMAIVRAIAGGERDPRRLAALRDGRCRKTEEEFARHLTGNWREEHLFNLERALALYDMLQGEVALYERRLRAEFEAQACEELRELEAPAHPSPAKGRALKSRGEEGERTALWRFAAADLTRIDGIGPGAARTVLTEVGLDLSAFPTEKHFVSWLRLAPRKAYSGGKPLSKRRRNGMGSTRVAAVLRMAATSLKHSKSALGASYRRIARLKGASVAVFATARKLAQLVYRMLRWGQDYVDEGEKAYEERHRARRLAGVKAAAKSLGYRMVPQESAPAAA